MPVDALVRAAEDARISITSVGVHANTRYQGSFKSVPNPSIVGAETLESLAEAVVELCASQIDGATLLRFMEVFEVSVGVFQPSTTVATAAAEVGVPLAASIAATLIGYMSDTIGVHAGHDAGKDLMKGAAYAHSYVHAAKIGLQFGLVAESPSVCSCRSNPDQDERSRPGQLGTATAPVSIPGLPLPVAWSILQGVVSKGHWMVAKDFCVKVLHMPVPVCGHPGCASSAAAAAAAGLPHEFRTRTAMDTLSGLTLTADVARTRRQGRIAQEMYRLRDELLQRTAEPASMDVPGMGSSATSHTGRRGGVPPSSTSSSSSGHGQAAAAAGLARILAAGHPLDSADGTGGAVAGSSHLGGGAQRIEGQVHLDAPGPGSTGGATTELSSATDKSEYYEKAHAAFWFGPKPPSSSSAPDEVMQHSASAALASNGADFDHEPSGQAAHAAPVTTQLPFASSLSKAAVRQSVPAASLFKLDGAVFRSNTAPSAVTAAPLRSPPPSTPPSTADSNDASSSAPTSHDQPLHRPYDSLSPAERSRFTVASTTAVSVSRAQIFAGAGKGSAKPTLEKHSDGGVDGGGDVADAVAVGGARARQRARDKAAGTGEFAPTPNPSQAVFPASGASTAADKWREIEPAALPEGLRAFLSKGIGENAVAYAARMRQEQQQSQTKQPQANQRLSDAAAAQAPHRTDSPADALTASLAPFVFPDRVASALHSTGRDTAGSVANAHAVGDIIAAGSWTSAAHSAEQHTKQMQGTAAGDAGINASTSASAHPFSTAPSSSVQETAGGSAPWPARHMKEVLAQSNKPGRDAAAVFAADPPVGYQDKSLRHALFALQSLELGLQYVGTDPQMQISLVKMLVQAGRFGDARVALRYLLRQAALEAVADAGSTEVVAPAPDNATAAGLTPFDVSDTLTKLHGVISVDDVNESERRHRARMAASSNSDASSARALSSVANIGSGAAGVGLRRYSTSATASTHAHASALADASCYCWSPPHVIVQHEAKHHHHAHSGPDYEYEAASRLDRPTADRSTHSDSDAASTLHIHTVDLSNEGDVNIMRRCIERHLSSLQHDRQAAHQADTASSDGVLLVGIDTEWRPDGFYDNHVPHQTQTTSHIPAADGADGGGGNALSTVPAAPSQAVPPGTKWPTSLLQISCGSDAWLIDLLSLYRDNQPSSASSSSPAPGQPCAHHPGLALLHWLFSHPGLLKVGYGLDGDLNRLFASHPMIRQYFRYQTDAEQHLSDAAAALVSSATVGPCLDIPMLMSAARSHPAAGSGHSALETLLPIGKSLASITQLPTSLSSTVELVLGQPLDKRAQTSDWQTRPLSRVQSVYAALDAHAVVEMSRKVLGVEAGTADDSSSSCVVRADHPLLQQCVFSWSDPAGRADAAATALDSWNGAVALDAAVKSSPAVSPLASKLLYQPYREVHNHPHQPVGGIAVVKSHPMARLRVAPYSGTPTPRAASVVEAPCSGSGRTSSASTLEQPISALGADDVAAALLEAGLDPRRHLLCTTDDDEGDNDGGGEGPSAASERSGTDADAAPILASTGQHQIQSTASSAAATTSKGAATAGLAADALGVHRSAIVKSLAVWISLPVADAAAAALQASGASVSKGGVKRTIALQPSEAGQHQHQQQHQHSNRQVPVLCLVPGDRRMDQLKVARAAFAHLMRPRQASASISSSSPSQSSASFRPHSSATRPAADGNSAAFTLGSSTNARQLKRLVRLATPDECVSVWGYAPGTFPPIGLKEWREERQADDNLQGLRAEVPSMASTANGDGGGRSTGEQIKARDGARCEWRRIPVFADASIQQRAVSPVEIDSPSRTSPALQDGPARERGTHPEPGTAAEDADASAEKVVYAGGGSLTHMLRLSWKQLVAASHALVVDISTPIDNADGDGEAGTGSGAARVAASTEKPASNAGFTTFSIDAATASSAASATAATAPPGAPPPPAAALTNDIEITGSIPRPRFLVDGMMGRLVRWLRVIGVDAESSNGPCAAEWIASTRTQPQPAPGSQRDQCSTSGDAIKKPSAAAAAGSAASGNLDHQSLVAWANASRRIILTRDRKLLNRKEGMVAFFVAPNDTQAQFEEVSSLL